MNWTDYPLMLRTHHIAEIFDCALRTVQKRVERGSPLLPAPSFVQPYGWRRADVQRWYETANVSDFRRALSRDARAQGEGASR